MGDTSYTGRKTWEAPRRHPPKRMGRHTAGTRGAPAAFQWSRYGGFIALAALAAGAILLHNGYLPPSLGNRETAIDGDSLRTAGKQIRLTGIDAPELFQTCRDEHGGEWACGRHAHAFLRALVSRGTLTCTPNGTDRYGRTLATCSAGPVADVSDAMVRAGFAINFMNGGYQAAEAEARTAKRGIWSGEFERPQDWRRRHPRGERG
jgi:endonuclease YncB( thermonuclease family)